jgi:hypothetical protein
VKKLALLSVAALMLASSVFAPVARAQAPGDVDILSWTLPPDDWWTVTGTIQCTEGGSYDLAAAFFLNIKPDKKKLKSPKKRHTGVTIREDFGDCEITGPQSFTLLLIPLPLTEKDKLWVAAAGRVCDFSQGEFTCNEGELVSERVKLR